jgi:hypothetical protein
MWVERQFHPITQVSKNPYAPRTQLMLSFKFIRGVGVLEDRTGRLKLRNHPYETGGPFAARKSLEVRA